MLTKIKPGFMPVEQFQADLNNICGLFDVLPSPDQIDIFGHVSQQKRAGLSMATIAKDVQVLRRTEKNAQRDPCENVFLIIQEEGQSLMQQGDNVSMLIPGDMILIDGAQASEFTFFGKYSRHLSVHLKRSDLRERFGSAQFGGRSIRRSDYHAIALSAIIGKAFEPNTSDTQSSFLHDAIFGVLGAVLWDERDSSQPSGFEAEISSAQILERGMAYIDRCYSDCSLTPGSLAETLEVSIRHLQRGFALAGLTPTDYLLKKRMEKACRLLVKRSVSGSQTLVSTIAYDSGFNDVSYFNRQFRKVFNCSPGQYPLVS